MLLSGQGHIPFMIFQIFWPKAQELTSAALQRMLAEIQLALDKSEDIDHQKTELKIEELEARHIELISHKIQSA